MTAAQPPSARDDRQRLRELVRGFNREREALLRQRLGDLDEERLATIAVRLEEDLAGRYESIARLRAQSEALLAEGDWCAVQELRGRAVEMGREFDDLREVQARVHDARQELLLRDALAARLGSQGRRAAYESLIMGLIVGVLGILFFENYGEVSDEVAVTLDLVDVGACVIFLVDLGWRYRLAEDKRWFIRRYWVDFITSIPLPSMQTLRVGRSLRLLRFVRLIRIARLAQVLRVVLFFWRGMDKLAAAFDVRLMRRSLMLLFAVLFFGSLGIWGLEGAPDAHGVETLGQSVWWTFATVVTGGFADLRNPDTTSGRLLTALLIIAGMVVVGIFTATLTSLLVREGDVSKEILALEERMLGELRLIKATLSPPMKEG